MMTEWKSDRVVEQLPLLRRYARSLTRDDSRADDLVHDALVRAYEKRHTFRRHSDLRAWLLSVIHNLFISQWRRENAARERETQLGELASAHAEPSQEHAIHLAQVRTVFASLPDEQRAALYLVGVEGLSYQESALALEIPIGTLMSRVSRARAALRQGDGANSGDESSRQPRNGLRIVRGSHE